MRTILTGEEREAFDNIPLEADEYVQIRYGTLQPTDNRFIRTRLRGDHNRLAVAIHIALLRWLGWQPDSLNDAPRSLVTYAARQLNLSIDALKGLSGDERVLREHRQIVREHLQWRDYGQAESVWLSEQLLGRALQHSSAVGLLEQAVQMLRESQILRPGITTLEAAVIAALGQADQHIHGQAARLLTESQKTALDMLVNRPDDEGGKQGLTFMLTPPSIPSADSLNDLILKLSQLRKIGIGAAHLASAINANKRQLLAQTAARLAPSELRRITDLNERHTLLACLVVEL